MAIINVLAILIILKLTATISRNQLPKTFLTSVSSTPTGGNASRRDSNGNIYSETFYQTPQHIYSSGKKYPLAYSPEDTDFECIPDNRSRSQLSAYKEHHIDAPLLDDELAGNRSHLSRYSTQRSNPFHSRSINLRPISDLPDVYRGIFKFGVFNAVQSTCFDSVFCECDNIVISAPTGSGKTVLFELAIIRMLKEAKDFDLQVKAVYMAPTKALCSERFRDWNIKFGPLGFELTGDTTYFGASDWGGAKDATIIITTVEKWESLTRSWGNHGNLFSLIRLLLVDEIHILNEPRGSTLEVVISRMKRRGPLVRFLLVSATIPNIEDIASWIGSVRDQEQPAQIYKFGEEFRPCELTRHVIGVPKLRNQNDFVFTKNLDYKLFSILQQYSTGKPVLVFCPTRKGVFATAEQLKKEYGDAQQARKCLPWSRPTSIDQRFEDKRLTDLATFGIGVHHAGLAIADRRLTEELYIKKVLRILVSTSTLAVGVNLPAHTVVIKGVKTFQGNASVEYSDLDIMQMLGRAGRPQFDKDGIAIILCEADLENKYKALIQGNTTLESSLHLNLSEYLNSEIALGTISDANSAKEWLRKSFLFQRIRKNPNYYMLGMDESLSWQQRMDDVISRSVANLKVTNLIQEKNGQLVATEYGDIMSKLYIRQFTMAQILALNERPTMREILETISNAEELCDSKIRASEKATYNRLRTHTDIRFELKKVEKTSDKVFLLLQAVLGGISLGTPELKSGDSQPYLEAFSIMRHAPRIARAVVEVAVVKKSGAQVLHGLEIMRCLAAKAWEDRSIVLRQIEHLGEKSIKVLAEHGVTSLDRMRRQSPLQIETLLNRRPPFGLQVLASVSELPQYYLNILELRVRKDHGRIPVEIDLSIECGLTQAHDSTIHHTVTRARSGRGHMTAILTITSDMDLIDFRRIPTKALKSAKVFEVTVALSRPSQSIKVVICSETIAGVTVEQDYRPNIPPNEYPVMDTRMSSGLEFDLTDLNDNPDFWDIHLDSDLEVPVAKAKSANGGLAANAEDRKLSNGKYECNHACKDKSKCRHYCCRDGLKDPPQAPKKAEGKTKKSYRKKVLDEGLSEEPQTISTARNVARQIKRLEDFHSSTNVAQSLRLSEGKRLKVTSSKQTLSKNNGMSEDQICDSEGMEEIKDALEEMEETNDSPQSHLLMSDSCDEDSATTLPEPCDLLPGHNPVEQATSSPKVKRKRSPGTSDTGIKRTKITNKHKQPVSKNRHALFLSSSDTDHEPAGDMTDKYQIIPKTETVLIKIPEDPGTAHVPDRQEFEELDVWLANGSVELV